MKQYSRIKLALIIGFISFNSYAANDMAGMDHSNMTPEQMKEMKGMNHDKMTPEQMKDIPVATQAKTPTTAKAGEGMPENSPEKAVKKPAKKKGMKKAKKPSMTK